MRPLMLDNEAKKRIAEVVKFAKSDIYRPGLSETIPGDDARHVVEIFNGFRAVFSFTEDPEGGLYRHLTISVDGPTYPNPIAAFLIADAFGFTDWKIGMGERMPPDWMGDANQEDRCITLLQRVKKEGTEKE
jgi:hypothetical protein